MGEWYDQKYKEMNGAWVTPAEDCNKWLDRIMKWVWIMKGTEVYQPTLLDIGCGGGHFIEQAEKRCGCTGIELSFEGIGETIRRVKSDSTEILKSDIEKTEFIDGEFDIITSIGTLEHVIDIPKALKEIHRILANDGIFYLYAPNELWDYTDQPNEVTMSKDEWMILLKDFKLLEFEKVGQNNLYILKKK